ncbi:glycosyltransferase [Vibrio vulnificus]|uniref:glycosyltransferase n=3 Tax=Vibrio vulnificus TaxID=672 RepID=UPI001CDC78E0|nr:glycosyltransferase [Vibrio vulnificus]MCA3908106.1 glycosyltransferase [Vibrio vulnificus]
MKKCFLFYMNEKPIPINNGVTVAVAGMANSLVKYGNVYVLDYSTNQLYQFKADFLLEEVGSIRPKQFDVIICSPILAIKNFLINKHRFDFKFNYIVAIINDNYTYVLWRDVILSIKFLYFSKKELIKLIKIPYVYIAEALLCTFPSKLIVQTKKDKSNFKFFPVSQEDILVCPNGTQFNFKESDINKLNRTGVGLVASFNETYLNVVIWFIDNVWVPLLYRSPTLKLHIVGKNNQRVYDYMKSKHPNSLSSIVVEPYYDDISLFYSKMEVVVSPIFKGYGLINKTIEAMQCGCIVVGDSAAFNGVYGFIDKKHGFIANNAEVFIDTLFDITKFDSEITQSMRVYAHQIIKDNFDWDRNAQLLIESIS